MSIRNLDKIFEPHRIAVVGASDTPTSVGYTVLRNLVGSGFRGVVYPVNPKHEAVQGIQAYQTISGLPHTPDLAVICTPAATVPDLIRQCGEAGTRGIVIISAGFREIGDEGRKLEELIRTEQSKFDGIRILGPNCLGIIVPGIHLNASFAAATPPAGHIGFISQSGALCTSVLDWALDQGVGFSYFVSVGNMLDVSMGDLIDYFGSTAETRSIILYIESISEAREFMSAARAFARTKPIVAYKAGRFTESAEAAASHTGAMAGVDAVYEAAFHRAGIERIFQVEDMFDCAELLARQQMPRGDRLAIITNAGGPGVMTTDALITSDGHPAKIADETMRQLGEFLPACWSHGNPIDVLGDAPPDRFAKAAEIVLKDENVDAVLVIVTPQAMTDPTATAVAVSTVANDARKPILAAWMGAHVVAEGAQLLNNAGIPTYNTPEKAVRAFMHLVSYARNLQILYETPKDVPLEFTLDRQHLRSVCNTILTEGGEILPEDVSKSLLEAYGIPVTKPQAAHTADTAVELAYSNSFELILGTKKDPVFGPVIMVGMGGVAAEVFKDCSLGLPPLNETLARRMLESLKSWPLLRGCRGKPGVNIDRLIEIVMRFSYLVADYPEIKELDINPLLVTPQDVLALGARVVVDREMVVCPIKPYAHLAIRPYPEEYVAQRTLKDGSTVTLRPIKPEDEPMWHELLAGCSQQSIALRFNGPLKQATHEMATRHCFVDYDRELGIVAEVEEEGRRKLIAVGRLLTDADHETAEYAVIVVDRWHSRGLGGVLTDYCIEVARNWGVKRIVAEVSKDNTRMLTTLSDRGFNLSESQEQDMLIVSRSVE